LIEPLDRIAREFERDLPSVAELGVMGQRVSEWEPAEGAMLDELRSRDVTEQFSAGDESGGSVAAPLPSSS